MADRYYRLVTLVVNICPEPLRELFLKYAMADSSTRQPFSTIEIYMQCRHKDDKLMKTLTRSQLCLIYNTGPIDSNNWDVSLLVSLLTEMFARQMTKTRSGHHLKVIRDHRNTLQHLSKTDVIQETYFTKMWTELRDSTMYLANIAKGPFYETSIANFITEALVSNMPNLGDTLSKWYSETITELKYDVRELQKDIEDIAHGTAESKAILKRSSWSNHTRASGGVSRRWKTVNPVVKHMQDHFASTMTHSLPLEKTIIETELREKHFVVVSGLKDSTHFQTTLAAIRSMKFTTQRSLQIVNPSEWRYVVEQDTDLVLFTNPFGTKYYDCDKARTMSDIQDSIFHAISYHNESNKLHVVLVTDIAILKEFLSHFDHEMYANPVMVSIPTTKTEPIDLAKEAIYSYDLHSADPQYSNLLVQSICHANQKKFYDANINYGDLSKAKTIIRDHKTLVITGHKGCGKTSMVVALLSSYDTGHFLILTEPDDVRLIKFSETCIVVIEDFTGKNYFDTSMIERWFRRFDMLLAVVREEKLKEIITSDETKLQLCQSQFKKHPILDHVIRLPTVEDTRGIETQYEPYSRATYSLVRLDQMDKNFQEDTKRRSFSYDIYANIDGSFYVSRERNVLLLNASFEIEQNFPVKHCRGICNTESGGIVMLGRREVSFQTIAAGHFQEKTSVNVRGSSESMAVSYCNQRVIVLNNHGDLDMYDSDMKFTDKFHIPVTWNRVNTIPSFVAENNCIFLLQGTSCCVYYYETCKMQYLNVKRFSPFVMCRCDNTSVFVLGKQYNAGSRIYQLDTKMKILSEIDVSSVKYDRTMSSELKMTFDKHNTRLVLMNKGKISESICLQRNPCYVKPCFKAHINFLKHTQYEQ